MKKIILLLLKPVAIGIGVLMKIFGIKSNIGGFQIVFPENMTNWERGSIWGNYEGPERFLVKKYVKPDDTVLEMGACLGVVSLTINRILTDKTKLVSVEPNPDIIEYLKKNRKNNNGCFIIENKIVTQEKEVVFHRGGAAFLGSSIFGQGNETLVEGITYEELESKYFPFSVIVMDIEGAELQFFQSFNLSNPILKTIIWESHPHILSTEELEKCYGHLNQMGFTQKDSSADVQVWIRN